MLTVKDQPQIATLSQVMKLQHLSIGELKVWLVPSVIKLLAVPAGPLAVLQPSRVPGLLQLVN